MKKLIIFDLDGTLIDTLEDLKNAVNHALSFYNYPFRSREQIRKAIGNGVAKLVERSIPDGLNNPNYKECLDIFTNYYSLHSEDNTFPYEGIKELLNKLKNDGYQLAVCTNKVNSIANVMIKKMFGDLFDIIQGDEPTLKKKPSPEMIDKILSILSVSKEDTIYIGDTNVDMETAINSNLDFIQVTYGYRTKEELLETCKETFKVDNMEELYKAIRGYK